MADFTITLEGGNLAEFDETSDGGGDMSATTASSRIGVYGISYVINGIDALWGRVTFDNKTTLRVGFFFDPNGLTMGAGDTFDIGADRFLNDWRVRFRYSGGNYQVCIEIMTDAPAWSASDWVTITDDWHWIEAYCQISTGVGNDDGFARLWVDPGSSPFGDPDTSVEDVDNDTMDLDGVRVGAVSGLDATTTGTFYIDHICGNDTGVEIGRPAAQTYYVDGDTGDNGDPGTEEEPWQTIIYAATMLQGGDTVNVKDGEYDGEIQVTHSGQDGHPITIQAYPGDRPVINTGSYGIRMGTGKNYIIIDGFEITALPWVADDDGTGIVGLNALYCTVQNCFIHDNDGHGILAYGALGWTVLDNCIEDNGFFGIFLSRSAAEVDPDGCIVRYNDVNGNGFDVVDDEGSGIFFNLSGSNCYIEYNFCIGNAGNGILVGGTCVENTIAYNVCRYNEWYGIWVSALVTETTVVDNVIHHNDVRHNNGGICITASYSNDVYLNYVAYNDLQLGRIGGGIIFYESDTDRAWNNTVYGNVFSTSASGIQLGAWWNGGGQPAVDTVLYNNIAGETTSVRSLECSLDGGSTLSAEDYNDFYGDVLGFVPGAHSIDADPLLDTDYRLGDGSPCIGTGTVAPALPGMFDDMGAFAEDDTTTTIVELGCFKADARDDAVILVGLDDTSVGLLHSNYDLLTAARAYSEIWASFRKPTVYVHRNDDGSMALAVGLEPATWPEDA